MATATEPLTDRVVTLRGHRPDDVDEMVVMCRDPASGELLVSHFHADGTVGTGELDNNAWYELLRP